MRCHYSKFWQVRLAHAHCAHMHKSVRSWPEALCALSYVLQRFMQLRMSTESRLAQQVSQSRFTVEVLKFTCPGKCNAKGFSSKLTNLDHHSPELPIITHLSLIVNERATPATIKSLHIKTAQNGQPRFKAYQPEAGLSRCFVQKVFMVISLLLQVQLLERQSANRPTFFDFVSPHSYTVSLRLSWSPSHVDTWRRREAVCAGHSAQLLKGWSNLNMRQRHNSWPNWLISNTWAVNAISYFGHCVYITPSLSSPTSALVLARVDRSVQLHRNFQDSSTCIPLLSSEVYLLSSSGVILSQRVVFVPSQFFTKRCICIKLGHANNMRHAGKVNRPFHLASIIFVTKSQLHLQKVATRLCIQRDLGSIFLLNSRCQACASYSNSSNASKWTCKCHKADSPPSYRRARCVTQVPLPVAELLVEANVSRFRWDVDQGDVLDMYYQNHFTQRNKQWDPCNTTCKGIGLLSRHVRLKFLLFHNCYLVWWSWTKDVQASSAFV